MGLETETLLDKMAFIESETNILIAGNKSHRHVLDIIEQALDQVQEIIDKHAVNYARRSDGHTRTV